MPHHQTARRATNLIGPAVRAIRALCSSEDWASARPRPNRPWQRGERAGEWRVWGADLWSTRYSLPDQINASNFDSLKVVWTWNAGAFGPDEYYRTTPHANGRLFTVATPRAGSALVIDPATGETLDVAPESGDCKQYDG